MSAKIATKFTSAANDGGGGGDGGDGGGGDGGDGGGSGLEGPHGSSGRTLLPGAHDTCKTLDAMRDIDASVASTAPSASRSERLTLRCPQKASQEGMALTVKVADVVTEDGGSASPSLTENSDPSLRALSTRRAAAVMPVTAAGTMVPVAGLRLWN